MMGLNKFLFITAISVQQVSYGACSENAARLNANGGSICNANNTNYTQTAIGQPVFNATGAGTTINANSPVVLNNTLAGMDGIGANVVNNGTINFNGFVAIETGRSAGNTANSVAVRARSGGTININAGANIVTHGSNSILNGVQRNNGLEASGSGGNAYIETSGPLSLDINGRDSRAITTQSNASNSIILHDNTNILMRGTNSRGLHANDGTTIMHTGDLNIRHVGISDILGTSSMAVYATATIEGAGMINLNNLEVVTLNSDVSGVVANGVFGTISPTITINGSTVIRTEGAGSSGVIANAGGVVIANQALVEASGANGVGIATILDNSILTINSGQIYGQENAINMSSGNNQQITLSNIMIFSGDGEVIDVNGATNANLQLTNTTNTLGSNQTLLNVSGSSTFTGNFSQSVLSGNVIVDAGSTSDLSLVSNTALTGMMNGGNTLIDASSQWNITSNSNLLNMCNNGLIDYGTYNGTFKQLTVNNYTTSGGNIKLNTALAGDSSPTDRVLVQGGTSGTGFVQIINASGLGAVTNEGIKIIEVVGNSLANFQLIGDYVFEGDPAVVGGAYAYRLYQNGISTPSDGDWYLRSSLLPTGENGSVSVSVSGSGSGNGPLYQPGVPLYAAYPHVMQNFNRLSTLQQRVGNRSWQGVSTQQQDAQQIQEEGVWFKAEGMRNKFRPKSSNVPFNFDANIWKLNLGIDQLLFKNANSKLILGLSAQYGGISSDVYSRFGNGKINSHGYGPKATLTWYQNNGLYVDAQTKLTMLDNDLSSTLAKRHLGNNRAKGGAFSIEAGKQIRLKSKWSTTPQAQLGYYKVNFNDFTDVYGASISLNQGESLIARTGISIDYESNSEEGNTLTKRKHFYGIANLYYDFLNNYEVNVSQVQFNNKGYPFWGGVGLGSSINWNNDSVSLYGEISANGAFNDIKNNYALTGNIGVRFRA